MTTHFRSIDSASVRAAEPVLFRLSTSPSIAAKEQKVDEVLADSFPASDPPPWTFGRGSAPSLEDTGTTGENAPVWSSHTSVIVAGGTRSPWQWLATGAGAIALVMMIPIVILLVGTPIAVAARLLIEGVAWLAGVLN